MIYIDLGCHNGDTIKNFCKGYFHGIDPLNVKSIGIDPLNKYEEEKRDLTERYSTQFIDKAAWVEDGEIDFSEKEQDIKSSIMTDKKNYKEGKIYKVPCFDFSKFVEDLNDEVVIRMDIEGAEYPVLEKMILDGTILKVKFLEVERHAMKMGKAQDFLDREKIIFADLNRLGIKYKAV